MGTAILPDTRDLAGKPLTAADQKKLDDLFDVVSCEADRFAGYPCNALFDYTPLYRFLSYPMNNVGDPFVPSNYHLNTHNFEREVLEIFRGLTRAPRHSYWGYVTSGGTEGNMYGMLLARELLPQGIVYHSTDSHYSVDKIIRCLRLRRIMIRSEKDGRMDLNDLAETIRAHRDVPPIIFANIGTTMKGAVDDLAGINRVIEDLAIPTYYIHADAALSGMILPYVDDPQPWDFEAGIHSIAISGHKMIGSPLPCGIVLALKSHVERVAQSVEYVGTLDTTILGSRDAVAPLFLWYAFKSVEKAGFRARIKHCFAMAEYAIDRLQAIGRHPWRHKNSVTVVFDRPSPWITSKWQLAAKGKLAHIITMPHVTPELIDAIVADIRDDDDAGE